MPTQRDKILIVDDDADVRALLREQVLTDRRFEVFEAQDGAEGLSQARQHSPDLIILDLVMPGLRGADFLVALKSQGYAGPVIVEAKRGNEASAIDCFRLGATDYLTKPLREAEVLRIIEHGLEEVRLRRERKELTDRLQQTNSQLEARVKTLTTLGSVGKSVTGMLDLEQLFNRVLDAAVSITEADHATLILRDEESGRLIMRAGKNMTLVMQEKLGEPLNDEIANLVMTSGQPLAAAGDALKRFRVSADLLAVIYAPLMIQGKPIGILTVGNHRKRRVFQDELAGLLQILADYGAIAIANARLFSALEKRARNIEHAYEELKTRDAGRDRTLSGIIAMRQPLIDIQLDLKRLSGAMPPKLVAHLGTLSQKIGGVLESVEELAQQERR